MIQMRVFALKYLRFDFFRQAYKPTNQLADQTSAAANISQLSGQHPRQFPRRSSVVVIPPMQVCPGDLLVYSKALTQRGNFPGTNHFF